MASQRLLYPIGIQSFSDLRSSGYLYIDKTEYIHQLVSTGKYYFLSRPRRFGKSLFMSTVEAFFQGRRDLFDGLAITLHPEYDWNPYPVFHFSLTGFVAGSQRQLREKLISVIAQYERIYGAVCDSGEPAIRFGQIIKSAFEKTGRQVVILIDEYDKPLLDTVDCSEIQETYRAELRAFYSNLKSMGEYIRFAMLSGVTKFGKLSIFSDLNNLIDISFQEKYNAICGITEEEMRARLMPGIGELAVRRGLSVNETLSRLKQNYDGYHFSPDSIDEDVYNPFSLLNALNAKNIGSYWFATGTPTFLVKMIRKGDMELKSLDRCKVSREAVESVSFAMNDIVPILYQTGYLTIKDYNPSFDILTLGYPNAEVEKGFMDQLLTCFSPLKLSQTGFAIMNFVEDLNNGNTEEFMQRLNSLFAKFQYDQIDLGHLELHYRNVIYLVSTLMGFYTRAESRTSDGRIDMTVETSEIIYIFEFKIDRSSEEAIEQISARQYDLPFRPSGKKIVMIGANFSNVTRRIDSWIIME